MSYKKSAKPISKNKPVDLAAFKLSADMFFMLVVTLGLGMTVLLYGACLRTNTAAISLSTIPSRHEILEKKVRTVVDGYPIEAMAPFIAGHEKTTAAFLVGIAKKESNWGKRVPVDGSGRDCFNYWGYRGAGSRGIEMGHGCFSSPEEAIGIVGGRIDTFVSEYHFDTPEELVVWKCGWSCDGHSNQSVKKWISDVGIYSRKIQ